MNATMVTETTEHDPAGAESELASVRRALKQLVEWRRIAGFTPSDAERYRILGQREVQLLDQLRATAWA
jgi:hypothetical protein